MPRIKRWHPVSHDFNRDPEIISLRRECGDWAAFAWLEILSIADRNDGVVLGSINEIADILAPVSLQMYHGRAKNAAKTMLKRFTDNSWITIGYYPDDAQTEHKRECIRVVNHTKYHRLPEHKNSQDGNKDVSPPDQTVPDQTKKHKNVSSPLPDGFELTSELKEWAEQKGCRNPEHEFETFKNYHLSKGSTMKNWDAAWKTWVQKSFFFNGPRGVVTPQRKPRQFVG